MLVGWLVGWLVTEPHSDKCLRGTGPQTPNHILQSCPTFDTLRRQTWPSPVDAHRKLWGLVETLWQTADFALLTGLKIYCFVGLAVKASAPRAEDPGFKSRLRGDFSGSSHSGDTPVATLPGAWRCRVSAGTGQSGVGILVIERESLICYFYLSVASRLV